MTIGNLRECPCGQPADLECLVTGSITSVLHGKSISGFVWSECCGEWDVRFNNLMLGDKSEAEVIRNAWNNAPRSTPKGTVITEDESTWPADGQVVFYKTRDSIPGAMVWIGVDYERFIDCIWWPADQFEPPTDKAGE